MTLSLPFVGKSVFVPGHSARTPEQLLPLAPYQAPADDGSELNPDLGAELQYSATFGQKHLTNWLKEHIRRMHSPLYDDWEVLCTAGNTDGVDGVMRALLDRGDYLLVEEFGELRVVSIERADWISVSGITESRCDARNQLFGRTDGHGGNCTGRAGEDHAGMG